MENLAGGRRLRDPLSYTSFFLQRPKDDDRVEYLKKIYDIGNRYPNRQNILNALEFAWNIAIKEKLFYAKAYSQHFILKVMLPYLGESVIRKLSRIPLERKIDEKESKKVIKKLALKHLPTDIVKRKKIGLPQSIVYR